MTLKPRQTYYKGTRMRSRLEALYAANIDNLGATWEYEPECFANERGQYLPDFIVHWSSNPLDWEYVEVKPTLAAALAAAESMLPILDTHPNARLVTVYPVGNWPHVSFVTATNNRATPAPAAVRPAAQARAALAAQRADRSRLAAGPAAQARAALAAQRADRAGRRASLIAHGIWTGDDDPYGLSRLARIRVSAFLRGQLCIAYGPDLGSDVFSELARLVNGTPA